MISEQWFFDKLRINYKDNLEMVYCIDETQNESCEEKLITVYKI